MAFKLDFGIWGDIFAVPAAIVDQHIQLCGSSSLKVLLVLLRHNQKSLEITDIARYVGLGDADTQDALNYWIASGVIRCTPEAGSLLISPGSSSGSVEHTAYQPVSRALPAEPAEPIATLSSAEHAAEDEQRIVRVSARPKLSQEQISIMARQDASIQSLIQEAQSLLGKPLSPASTETLVALYSYGGLSVELILMVIQYCVSKDKGNMRYIEATAYDWIDRGIDTFDKAEMYIVELTQRDDHEKMIKSAFGIFNRSLTSKELEFSGKWLDTYKFDMQMIQLAYERTVDNKGKLSFPYCDAILSKWHEKGIRTPRQAIDEMNAPFTPTPMQSEYSKNVRNAPDRRTGAPSADKERYDRAHLELQRRRNEAREHASRRKEEAYARLPRLKEIDATLAKTGIEVSRAVLMGGNTGALLGKLKEKNLSLQLEKEETLASGGFPRDYLETPYACKECEDKGYRPSGEACSCLKELLG